MPRTITFHLDEQLHPAIAEALRRRTINVTTTPDEGLVGASDPDQLTFARATGRVIVTRDADFLSLHHQGIAHAGIAYAHPRRSIGYIIHHLVLIWEVLEATEMTNRLEYL
jgi:hypothetical protein